MNIPQCILGFTAFYSGSGLVVSGSCEFGGIEHIAKKLAGVGRYKRLFRQSFFVAGLVFSELGNFF